MSNDINMSEAHEKSPRINSSYHRSIYDEIVELTRHLNFNHPIFANRLKRNHSLGSVQAFIVEVALTNENFRNYLREFMVAGGKGWMPRLSEYEKYNSPADIEAARKKFRESVDSREMFAERDKKKLIDPKPPVPPRHQILIGQSKNTRHR